MDQKVQNTDESRDDLGFLALLAPEIRGSFTAAGWSHPPVWHEKSRKLDLVLSSPAPLPFQAYEALLTALRLRFHCSVDLKVEAEDPKADLSVLDSYISWLHPPGPGGVSVRASLVLGRYHLVFHAR